ncbi:MAG: hypothetical protein WKF43_06700 [Acidimicrobiales bacterium]
MTDRAWHADGVLECVVNISEGRRPDVIATVAGAARNLLLDVHTDADHNRSVLTLALPDTQAEEAVQAVTETALRLIDVRQHDGVHPRIGAVDVVPFVALEGSVPTDAVAARNRFARWAGDALALPCFLYGPERSLPDVRRWAFTPSLTPDTGPPRPHPSAGGVAVGSRPVLVAYNVWLDQPDLARARRIAGELRSDTVRALGLAVGDRVQVSMNLVAPTTTGPAQAFDAVAAKVRVAGVELVGLVPRAVLDAVPVHRWNELDLAEDRTIESRWEAAGLRGP